MLYWFWLLVLLFQMTAHDVVKALVVFYMPIVPAVDSFAEMVQYPNAIAQDMLLWIYKNLKDVACGKVGLKKSPQLAR